MICTQTILCLPDQTNNISLCEVDIQRQEGTHCVLASVYFAYLIKGSNFIFLVEWEKFYVSIPNVLYVISLHCPDLTLYGLHSSMLLHVVKWVMLPIFLSYHMQSHFHSYIKVKYHKVGNCFPVVIDLHIE